VAASALAAVVIGSGGYVVALIQRALPLSLVVPGIVPLPALTIYGGMLLLSSGQTINGNVTLLDAASRGLALAAGVLVAELVGQPVRRILLRDREDGRDDDKD